MTDHDRILFLESAVNRLLNACTDGNDVIESKLKTMPSSNLENRTITEQNVPNSVMEKENIMAKEHRIRVKTGTNENGNPIICQLSASSELELADKVILAVVKSGRIYEFLPQQTPQTVPQEIPVVKKTNFQSYAEHWRSTYKQGKEKNTDVFLDAKLNVLNRTFGTMDIEDFSTAEIQNFLNERAKQYKKATIKADWAILKEILDSAVDDCIITKNPAKDRRLHNPGEEGAGTQALTLEQITAIQRAIPGLEDERERCLIALLAYTSMRREEVLGLRWENVDFERHVIYICEAIVYATTVAEKKKTKTKSSERIFPISDPLYAILSECRKEDGYIIHGRGNGPISSASYRRLWQSLSEHIELYGMTAMNFRTTFATMAVASGVDIRTTQSLMGHSTPDMTLKVYTKQENTRLPAAIAQMENFLQVNKDAPAQKNRPKKQNQNASYPAK